MKQFQIGASTRADASPRSPDHMKGNEEEALRSNSSNCVSNERDQERDYYAHRTRSDFEFQATRHTNHNLSLNLTGSDEKAGTDAGCQFGSGSMPSKDAFLNPCFENSS